MKTAILYGIGEGDYHGRAFVAALQQAGFEVVRDARQADMVIAHSGGCFFLPPIELNKKIVLINPPYWPGKPLALSMAQKIWRDFLDYAHDRTVGQWLIKSLMNCFHLVRYAIKTITIMLHAHRQRFYEALKDENTIIIRSDHDPFLRPDTNKILQEKYGHAIPFFQVNDEHDGCWHGPKPYIDIIQKFSSSRKGSVD